MPSPAIDALRDWLLTDNVDEDATELNPTVFKAIEPVVTSTKPSDPVESSIDSAESTITALLASVVVRPPNARTDPPAARVISSDKAEIDVPECTDKTSLARKLVVADDTSSASATSTATDTADATAWPPVTIVTSDDSSDIDEATTEAIPPVTMLASSATTMPA
jgi:hypothetical protein